MLGPTTRVDLDTIELRRPDVRWHRSWLRAADEFAGAGEYQHGSGLAPQHMLDADVKGKAWRPEQLSDPDLFAAFVADMTARVDRAVTEPVGLVPDTKSWIVSGEEFLGSMSVRHELNDWLREEGGHIGYSVRPSARRQGVATRALQLALAHASELRLTRVLLTCDDDNVGSAATIERCGGVLEDVRRGKRRYWIPLAP